MEIWVKIGTQPKMFKCLKFHYISLSFTMTSEKSFSKTDAKFSWKFSWIIRSVQVFPQKYLNRFSCKYISQTQLHNQYQILPSKISQSFFMQVYFSNEITQPILYIYIQYIYSIQYIYIYIYIYMFSVFVEQQLMKGKTVKQKTYQGNRER